MPVRTAKSLEIFSSGCCIFESLCVICFLNKLIMNYYNNYIKLKLLVINSTRINIFRTQTADRNSK